MQLQSFFHLFYVQFKQFLSNLYENILTFFLLEIQNGFLMLLNFTFGQSIDTKVCLFIFIELKILAKNRFQLNIEWKPIPRFQFDTSYHLSYSSLLELVAAPFVSGL